MTLTQLKNILALDVEYGTKIEQKAIVDLKRLK
jgi:hypothetical protein